MFGVVMGGTATAVSQNPMRVQFDANQSSTAGYIVLRLNATHTAVGSGPKLLQTWEFAGTQRSVVDISGSIGIGMTGSVPLSASLHISGANTANLLRIQSPASSSILFVSGSGNIGMGLTVPSAQLHISGASNSVLFEIDSPAQNNILFVTGSGRVGIGTTLPTASLHISGASNSNLLQVQSPAQTNIFVISGSGDVGIGTATPTQKLHILNGNILLSDTQHIDWSNGSERIIGGGIGTGYSLQFSTYGPSTALTEKMRISGSGEVGIGVTTPSARLHVSGSSNSVLFEIDSPAINNIIYVSGSGRVGIGTSLPTASFHISGAAVDRLLHVSSPSQANILFVTGSGRVGIGTSIPDELLSVVRSGNPKIIAGDYVGIQTTPAEWIDLFSEPVSSKYIQIAADQISNSPTEYTATPNKIYGTLTQDANVLGTPDYWMEIKLGANAGGAIVLIPCYLPAP
jgi:hypothetical protein